MEIIFGGGMTTSRYAMGSGEALGQFSGFGDDVEKKPVINIMCDTKPVDLTSTKQQVDQKTMQKPPTTTEVSEAPGRCAGVKRKRVAMSEEDMLMLTNMTDAVNNVAHALRETGPEQVHPDLYQAVMLTLGFTEEALIVAFSHLLDNKSQGNSFVNMADHHRCLWLRTWLGKHYYQP
jgi:hypothetical protein